MTSSLSETFFTSVFFLFIVYCFFFFLFKKEIKTVCPKKLCSAAAYDYSRHPPCSPGDVWSLRSNYQGWHHFLDSQVYRSFSFSFTFVGIFQKSKEKTLELVDTCWHMFQWIYLSQITRNSFTATVTVTLLYLFFQMS